MKTYKLKELLTIVNGKDYKSQKHGTIPVYGSGGVMLYIDNYLYDGESILLPRKGTLDNIMYVNGKFWTVDTIYWTKVNKTIAYPRYLYYYLSSLDLSRRDSGSTLPSMTFDSYYTLDIILPELFIQKKIADTISSLDRTIDNNLKINTELEELVKTIYDYWFLQFDFPDKNGKPYKSSGGKMVYSDELKREIPEGWSVKKLSEICQIYQPKTISNKELVAEGYYMVYGAGGFMGYYDKYNHEESEIIISCRGNCGIRYYTQPFSWITGNAMVIRPHDIFLQPYIFQCMSLDAITPYITGSVQKQITRSKIGDMLIVIPPQSLVQKYNESCKPSLELKISLEQENIKLSKIRDFLLPLLMSGQVTIKD